MKRYIKSVTLNVSDDDILTRIAVAKDFSTRPEILGQLSWDYNPTVREAVAGNPNTPEEILRRLSSDSDPWVSGEAATALVQRRNSL